MIDEEDRTQSTHRRGESLISITMVKRIQRRGTKIQNLPIQKDMHLIFKLETDRQSWKLRSYIFYYTMILGSYEQKDIRLGGCLDFVSSEYTKRSYNTVFTFNVGQRRDPSPGPKYLMTYLS